MIAILLANGFEEIEALTPLDILRRANLDVKTVSITDEKCVKGAHGIEVLADITKNELDLSSLEYVIFPGGLPGAENLDKSEFTDRAIDAVKKNSGGFAAICAAPMVLGHRGLLEGKRACCYPGFEKELSGAKISGENVVTDGNVITAVSMGASYDFALAIVKALKNKEESESLADSTLPSNRKLTYFYDLDFVNVVLLATEKGKIATSLIQRKCCISYGKAAKYIDVMEEMGLISEQNGQRPRDVLITRDDFLALLKEAGVSIAELKASEEYAKKPYTYLYNFEEDANKESLLVEKTKPDFSSYAPPSTELLDKAEEKAPASVDVEVAKNAEMLLELFSEFDLSVTIRSVDVGPRFIRYGIVPEKRTRVSSIVKLFDDISLTLGKDGVRMEAPIPGTSAIGLEIPREAPEVVRLRELIESEEFEASETNTAVCIGKDIEGNAVLADIAKMPHALIAGATGMGKSVLINSIITSLIYHARPDELKLVLIDPKMVEFDAYKDIPHLLVPVICDVNEAAAALKWATDEMERRYDAFMNLSLRNIDTYNKKVAEDASLGEPLPKIVIVIDELSDLMLGARKPTEELIMRIAQKARAAGIHLIIGTQKPSVNVLTGVIKANIPTRISFKLSSYTDSRTVLEQAGAEKLLDKGDMLFWPAGAPKPLRVQGAFISDAELLRVTDYLKAVGCDYDEAALEKIRCTGEDAKECDCSSESDEEEYSIFNDPQFIEAVEVAIENGKISTALIQRKLGIGYGRAAKFIDEMTDLGLISEPSGQKPREVLASLEEWQEMLTKMGVEDCDKDEEKEDNSPLLSILENLNFDDDSVWETVEDSDDEDELCDGEEESSDEKEEFSRAVDVALNGGKVSTSLLQRKLGVGYGKAAKIIDAMKDMGIISEDEIRGSHDVLITRDEWLEILSRRGLD